MALVVEATWCICLSEFQ